MGLTKKASHYATFWAALLIAPLGVFPSTVETFGNLLVEAMANAIDRLLKDSKLRRDLSCGAVERAKAFSWESTAEKTLAVLKDAAI